MPRGPEKPGGEGEQQNEGTRERKKDLREVQGHQPPRCGARDLRERKAQAAPGLISQPRQVGGTPRRDQKSVIRDQS